MLFRPGAAQAPFRGATGKPLAVLLMASVPAVRLKETDRCSMFNVLN